MSTTAASSTVPFLNMHHYLLNSQQHVFVQAQQAETGEFTDTFSDQLPSSNSSATPPERSCSDVRQDFAKILKVFPAKFKKWLGMSKGCLGLKGVFNAGNPHLASADSGCNDTQSNSLPAPCHNLNLRPAITGKTS